VRPDIMALLGHQVLQASMAAPAPQGNRVLLVLQVHLVTTAKVDPQVQQVLQGLQVREGTTEQPVPKELLVLQVDQVLLEHPVIPAIQVQVARV